ncbi:MAG: hypothetical protein RMJ55_04910 [Roseiflexaceae bacterium]|nr:hypothetical protein [Roseiflexus sp.]MDW8212874.1 hypothetical protein [Roseiflexaceae bacterium]
MLPAIVSIPRNGRLTAIVNRLLDEELERRCTDQQESGALLPLSARAAIVEIVTRTVERLNRETCQLPADEPVMRYRDGSR